MRSHSATYQPVGLVGAGRTIDTNPLPRETFGGQPLPQPRYSAGANQGHLSHRVLMHEEEE